MTDSDLTVSILREIREELRGVRAQVETTNVELRGLSEATRVTNDRLDVTNQRLSVVEHTVSDAAAQIVLLARYVKSKHETAIDDLRERVTRLEAKAPG